jgi:hypothetical protein
MNKIEIDDEVFSRIKAEAEPFTDTPNSVLRRKYGLDAAKAKAARAPQGSILPEDEYEVPILKALTERGGSAHAKEVVDAVGEILGDRLTEKDREPLKSGDLRWRNRTAFVRMTLKNKGQLKDDSPRGVWELTEAGKARAEGGGE